jgi:hypothetical protein
MWRLASCVAASKLAGCGSWEALWPLASYIPLASYVAIGKLYTTGELSAVSELCGRWQAIYRWRAGWSLVSWVIAGELGGS